MLATAAENIAAEIESLARWEADLLDDLAATRKKREALLRAVDPVLASLRAKECRALRLRLLRLAVAVACGLQ